MATIIAEGASVISMPMSKRKNAINHDVIGVCSLEAYGDKLAQAIGQVFGLSDIRETE